MNIADTTYTVIIGLLGATPMTANADTVARLYRAYRLIDCSPRELKLRDRAGVLLTIRPTNPDVHLAFS